MTANELMEEIGVMQTARILNVWPNYVRTLIFMGKLEAVKKPSGGCRTPRWVLKRSEVLEYARGLEKFRSRQKLSKAISAGIRSALSEQEKQTKKKEKQNGTRNGKNAIKQSRKATSSSRTNTVRGTTNQ